MLLSSIKRLFIQKLSVIYDEQEALNLMYYTLEVLTGKAKKKLISENDIPIEESKLNEIINQLLQNEPIQYILGKAFFNDVEYIVTKDVLIPRPETEELIYNITKDYDKNAELSILDLCTGSGCIAIELSKYFVNAKVQAIDVDENGIQVALKNNKLHQTNVGFFVADIFQFHSNQKFDIIVSNPPYVMNSEKSLMKKNVLDYEPHKALFVSDLDPLVFYKQIANIASRVLQPNGSIYLEINEALGPQTSAVMSDVGFESVTLIKDIFDKDRMIKAKRQV
jgi:release factor glutamine methyltransferase